uniref:Secreted protein n=1 Tax=Setaria viridis TaxID=4556 RepID=A0A4U6V945_SETVI|nr:hypothetical protein SEVIR_3G062800v2 [Setaria viridis]
MKHLFLPIQLLLLLLCKGGRLVYTCTIDVVSLSIPGRLHKETNQESQVSEHKLVVLIHAFRVLVQVRLTSSMQGSERKEIKVLCRLNSREALSGRGCCRGKKKRRGSTDPTAQGSSAAAIYKGIDR